MQAVRGERETACEFAQRGRFAFGDTVTVIGVVVATLPAASYARALRVWLPLSLRALQLKLYGYEVARQIRGTAGNDFLLIAVTGWAQDSDKAQSKAAGLDHHLT